MFRNSRTTNANTIDFCDVQNAETKAYYEKWLPRPAHGRAKKRGYGGVFFFLGRSRPWFLGVQKRHSRDRRNLSRAPTGSWAAASRRKEKDASSHEINGFCRRPTCEIRERGHSSVAGSSPIARNGHSPVCSLATVLDRAVSERPPP